MGETIHKELITSGKFDDKFKRALLDFYTYGFKNLDSYDKNKKQILTNDWDRLRRITSDYMKWSANKSEVMYMNFDPLFVKENPFHRVYRFCRYPRIYPSYFFHTMAALSSCFEIRDDYEVIEADTSEREYSRFETIKNKSTLKTSDLVNFFYGKEMLDGQFLTDQNKTPNRRLTEFCKMGLLHDEKKRRDHCWSLSEFTIKKLLDTGRSVSGEKFERHLRSALDFYSKYYLLGEVGTFLLDRFSKEEDSPFRFNHEYFMQALNDYNIVDILHAIECKKWCRINYRHGTSGFVTELLCYPLEIRISNLQGREYLMCYEPFRHSCISLRIEFIDDIEYYEESAINSILQEALTLSEDSVRSDIENARRILPHVWGVSTSENQQENTRRPPELHPVIFKIACDPENEGYVERRMKRESRFGAVTKNNENQDLTFSIAVTDKMELRPWIRSFYSRILICEGMDTASFSLEHDVERMLRSVSEDTLTAPKENTAEKNERWKIPEEIRNQLGKGTEAREHDLIFHETFSVYYYVIADVFKQLCALETPCRERDIDNAINYSLTKYNHRTGCETNQILPGEIKEMLINEGFLKVQRRVCDSTPKYIPKYRCDSNVELYRDVIPITKMEQRWLASILRDDKIGLFLSADEIDCLKKLLDASSVSPLPMGKIVYPDRFHSTDTKANTASFVFAVLLKGILDKKILRVRYATNKGEFLDREFKPIILEFSKRYDRFQCFLQECESGQISTMNLSQIQDAAETEQSFDYDKAEKNLRDYMAEETKGNFVELEFYDEKNMTDRILTAFAPYEKRCCYCRETGKYTLRIQYGKRDEIDLAIRLMGYGDKLHFTDRKHLICVEIRERLNRQLDIFRRYRKLREDIQVQLLTEKRNHDKIGTIFDCGISKY